jgi:hypothetical protein
MVDVLVVGVDCGVVVTDTELDVVVDVGGGLAKLELDDI